MLTISKPKPNRVDVNLNGGIDANIMTAAMEDLIRASEDVTDGTMLYTIADFDMPTLGALGVELTYLKELFALPGKFKKCAVLSDQSWIRTAAELEGAIIPHFEIKSFHLNEASAAEAWLAV